MLNFGSRSVIQWNQHTYQKTILNHERSNAPTMYSAPSNKKYQNFCKVCEAEVNWTNTQETVQQKKLNNDKDELYFEVENIMPTTEPMARPEDLDPQMLSQSSTHAELLQLNYKLGHAPLNILKVLALSMIIPSRLAKVPYPKCAGCLYGSMTRQPKRTRLQPGKIGNNKVDSPGDCVLVDRLQSPHAGFVAQLKGKLTCKSFMAATVFVDHLSRFSYFHLQL